MKTENLKFEDAIQKLYERQCDGIAPQDWDEDGCYYVMNAQGIFTFSYSSTTGIPCVSFSVSRFFDKWKLINPKTEKG